MRGNVYDVLKKYSIISYYNEIRDENGKLLFSNGHSFNKVAIDNATKYITLINDNDPGNICMLNPNLEYNIISLGSLTDQLLITNGNNILKLFCKKIKKV